MSQTHDKHTIIGFVNEHLFSLWFYSCSKSDLYSLQWWGTT